jgi:nicotinate-nucleotide pyrophosphorylase (carboxylating)
MSEEFDPPPALVRDAVVRALDEDLGALGDLTGVLVPDGARMKGDIVARADGVLAGRACAAEVFAEVDRAIEVEWLARDGMTLIPNTTVARVHGPARSVLIAERTALNFLSHLSGVATLTRRFVRAAAGRGQIRDTRKTTPGLRALEKAAVRAGGGINHRASLSDGILIKDNHLALLAVSDAVKAARSLWPGRPVEVECDSLATVEEAVAAGAELVLLDNMTPDEVRDAVERVGGRAGIEVSGGVTLETVADYAATGVDFISVGAITHSAPILDIGLDVT